MAKVAFDVQGTLKGRHSAKVVRLFKFLEARGHSMYIWSFGGFYMANEARADLNLGQICCQGKTDRRWEGDQDMDVCVDDDMGSAKNLSADQVIDVAHIPEKEEDFENFVLKFSL